MRKTIYAVSIITALFIGLASCTSKSKSDSKATQENVIDAAHNSRNSLDWNGNYTGVIPCADCEGIEVHITLNADETCQISYLYLGKSDTPETMFSGKFTWDDAGNIIAVDAENFPSHYKVGENKLIILDMKGCSITGQHEDMYVLTKN